MRVIHRSASAGIRQTLRAGSAALFTAFMASGSLVAQLQTQASYPLLTDLLDATATYGPVSLVGNGGPAPGLPNNGVCVNGIYAGSATGGQDVVTPPITSLNTNDFQIDIDFNMTALPAGNRPVFMASRSYRYIGIYMQANGTVGMKHNNSNLAWSTTILAPGTWYSASLQYDSGVAALSINGALVQVVSVGPLNTGGYTDFTTNDWSTGTNFNGCIRNLVISNDTTIPAANWFSYGAGCVVGSAPGFYQQFTGSSFDLSNTGVTMQLAPPIYVLLPGAAPIVQPTSAARTISRTQTIQVTLPWAFPYQLGGLTNALWVCSNGWVSLEATTLTDSSETVAELLSGPARVFGMWDDLDPSTATGGGTVHWEQDPANATLFHVTFLGVPEYGTTNTNDLQYTFHQSGTIEMKWGNCSVSDCIVGFALGNGQNDPGSTDVSAITGPLLLGDGVLGLGLKSLANDRPVLGTTFDMQVSHIPATASLGAMFYSWTKYDPGISLTSVGMDSCFLYVNLGASVLFVPSGPTANTQIAFPNLPALIGRHVYAQAAVLGSTATALGLISSNGGDMLMDVN